MCYVLCMKSIYSLALKCFRKVYKNHPTATIVIPQKSSALILLPGLQICSFSCQLVVRHHYPSFISTLTWAGNQCYVDAAALMSTLYLSAFLHFLTCPIKCHSSFVSIHPINHSFLHLYFNSQVSLPSFMNFITPLLFFPPLTLPFRCGSYEKKKILKTWEERKGKLNILCYKTAPQLEKLWLICSFQHTSFLCSTLTGTKHKHLLPGESPFAVLRCFFTLSHIDNMFQEVSCCNIMYYGNSFGLLWNTHPNSIKM